MHGSGDGGADETVEPVVVGLFWTRLPFVDGADSSFSANEIFGRAQQTCGVVQRGRRRWRGSLGRPLNSTAFADVDSKLSLHIPAHRIGNLAISTHLLRGSDGKRGSWIILPLIFALSSNSPAQDNFAPIQPSSRVGENEKGLVVAEGELVKELDDAIWHVFQASNNDY